MSCVWRHMNHGRRGEERAAHGESERPDAAPRVRPAEEAAEHGQHEQLGRPLALDQQRRRARHERHAEPEPLAAPQPETRAEDEETEVGRERQVRGAALRLAQKLRRRREQQQRGPEQPRPHHAPQQPRDGAEERQDEDGGLRVRRPQVDRADEPHVEAGQQRPPERVVGMVQRLEEEAGGVDPRVEAEIVEGKPARHPDPPGVVEEGRRAERGDDRQREEGEKERGTPDLDGTVPTRTSGDGRHVLPDRWRDHAAPPRHHQATHCEGGSDGGERDGPGADADDDERVQDDQRRAGAEQQREPGVGDGLEPPRGPAGGERAGRAPPRAESRGGSGRRRRAPSAHVSGP